MIKWLIYGGIAFIAYTIWKNANAGKVKPLASAPPKNGALTSMNKPFTGVDTSLMVTPTGKLAFSEGASDKINMNLASLAAKKSIF